MLLNVIKCYQLFLLLLLFCIVVQEAKLLTARQGTALKTSAACFRLAKISEGLGLSFRNFVQILSILNGNIRKGRVFWLPRVLKHNAQIKGLGVCRA